VWISIPDTHTHTHTHRFNFIYKIILFPDCTAPFWVRVHADAIADTGEYKTNRGKARPFCLSVLPRECF